jgi:hypothetical protein
MSTVTRIWTANGWEAVAASDVTLLYRRPGTQSVTVGADPMVFPYPIEIQGISGAVQTAPAGADLIVDVNRNGTTIFTTQANRPRIVAGSVVTSTEVTNMDVTQFAAGDELTVDVDQVGSSTSGSGLTLFIRYTK